MRLTPITPFAPSALLALLALALVSPPVLAQDRAEIDPTKIIGNRELPKVLYIVPWKKPLPGNLSGKPVSGVMDEVLAPVDRDVFRRQVRYHTEVQYQGQVEPPGSTANGPASPATPATPTPPAAPPVRN